VPPITVFSFFNPLGWTQNLVTPNDLIPQTQIHQKLCLRWNQGNNPFWGIRKRNGAIELVYELGHGDLVIGYWLFDRAKALDWKS
jgi:hypothetical protein